MHIGKILIIFSFISIITTIIFLSKSVYSDYIEITKYDDVYNYINNTKKTNLDGVLEIPSINLKVGIVDNVDKGLVFVNDRLIAGHSGNCKVCYFDDLDKFMDYLFNKSKDKLYLFEKK